MNYNWINKNGNKNFILFMNGWGMDKEVVKFLEPLDYDILEIDNYTSLDNSLCSFEINKYEKKYLIAWSMGVYTANFLKDDLANFDRKIAISGTNKMIDNEFGIPVKIYNCTVKHFSNESKDKFIQSMFLAGECNLKINRSTEELKKELVSIQNFSIDYELEYDRAFVPIKDNIVPYKNQFNYWKKKNTEIIEINSGHYVFGNFKSWQDIIC